jgi:preprotein translocase subunit SecE
VAETTAGNLEQPSSGGPLSNVSAWPQRAKEYFEDLKSEMRKVTWPTRKQVEATTAVVLATIFIFAFYFAAVDLVLGRAITRLFAAFAK